MNAVYRFASPKGGQGRHAVGKAKVAQSRSDAPQTGRRQAQLAAVAAVGSEGLPKLGYSPACRACQVCAVGVVALGHAGCQAEGAVARAVRRVGRAKEAGQAVKAKGVFRAKAGIGIRRGAAVRETVTTAVSIGEAANARRGVTFAKEGGVGRRSVRHTTSRQIATAKRRLADGLSKAAFARAAAVPETDVGAVSSL